eukprot:scaffold305067_cov47-Attheya_sp.AAC.1
MRDVTPGNYRLSSRVALCRRRSPLAATKQTHPLSGQQGKGHGRRRRRRPPSLRDDNTNNANDEDDEDDEDDASLRYANIATVMTARPN